MPDAVDDGRHVVRMQSVDAENECDGALSRGRSVQASPGT